MRCPPVWGLLWLWWPLGSTRPVRLEKVQADTRNLTRTLSARIQHLQLLPLSLPLPGEAGGPSGGGPPGLEVLARRLQGLQGLLPPGPAPLVQVANDLENLLALLGLLGAHLGCEPPPASQNSPPTLEEAPHTAARLALAQLRLCLGELGRGLEGTPKC